MLLKEGDTRVFIPFCLSIDVQSQGLLLSSLALFFVFLHKVLVACGVIYLYYIYRIITKKGIT